jgi:hypothetical protein
MTPRGVNPICPHLQYVYCFVDVGPCPGSVEYLRLPRGESSRSTLLLTQSLLQLPYRIPQLNTLCWYNPPSSILSLFIMHTVWVRLNAVVFFGLSVLLGLSCLAAISKIGHASRHQPGESFF